MLLNQTCICIFCLSHVYYVYYYLILALIIISSDENNLWRNAYSFLQFPVSSLPLGSKYDPQCSGLQHFESRILLPCGMWHHSPIDMLCFKGTFYCHCQWPEFLSTECWSDLKFLNLMYYKWFSLNLSGGFHHFVIGKSCSSSQLLTVIIHSHV
jgi:hypothetical protein